ncbi:MAG: efflux RND transporter periplasmic adaptor subunit [Thiotrichales bacterium]
MLNRQTIAVLALCTAMILATTDVLAEPQTYTVESAQAFRTATVGGTVIPYKEVTLSAQIPGRIKQIAGKAGDTFATGTVLVAIDDSVLRAKRQAVQAQIANAKAALDNAQVQYNRELISPRSESTSSMPGFGMPILMDNIFTRQMGETMGYGEPGFERHADLYAAMTGVNQAQAAYLTAQSQLQELDANIRDASSVAPFDGVILEKLVEVGDTVQPGQPLIRFGHVKYLRVQADVPYRLAGGLEKGMQVGVLLDDGSRVMARVAQIFPMADPTNHTVTVKFDLPVDSTATLGMYAELFLPAAASQGGLSEVVIPRSALIKGRTLPAVLVLSPNGTSSVRLVRLGRDLGNGQQVVLSGLKPGMTVFLNPPPGAKSGWTPGRQAEGASAH